jgi:hypothetical protein
VVRSNAFTEYKASKSLYDTKASVPGADVGSDPSRAFILADESLLKTVRLFDHMRNVAFDMRSRARAVACGDSDNDCRSALRRCLLPGWE